MKSSSKHFVLLMAITLFVLHGCQDNSTPMIFSSYEEGVKNALKNDRRILLIFDFWGNPTLSSERLLHDEEIIPLLQHYTFILLYVDEKKGVEGKKNARLQLDKFGASTQPMYYLLENDETLVKGPLEYCKKAVFMQFISPTG